MGDITCAQLATVPVLTALADEESHQEEGWQAFVDVSEDGGETFTRSPNVAMPEDVGVIQPTLWESNVGVHMMLRSNAGHIYRADSVRASPSALIGEGSVLSCSVLWRGGVSERVSTTELRASERAVYTLQLYSLRSYLSPESPESLCSPLA